MSSPSPAWPLAIMSSPSVLSPSSVVADVRTLAFAPSPSPDAVLVTLRDYLQGIPSPTFFALSDGSVLTQNYVETASAAKVWLWISGALCAFFFRNTLNAIAYLRRSRAKDKTLFYLLLASQLLAFVTSLSVAIADFDQSVDCKAISVARKLMMKISDNLMIIGILGIKAYRCLGNSRLVLVFLLTSAAATATLLGLEASRVQGHRTLTGSCLNAYDTEILTAIVMLAFVETAVLCACFFYAIWKSYRTQAEARVTIRVADDGEEKQTARARRGWWDYVPETTASEGCTSFLGATRAFVERVRQLWRRDVFPSSVAYQRKTSLPGPHPLPQPARAGAGPRRRSAAAPVGAVVSRWIRYFSRVELFRKMLRDELLYTTLLAVTFLSIAIVMLVGVSKQFLLGEEEWLIVDWVVITLFTMHSFERVVRRHEFEAVLQHPSAWDRMLRTDDNDATRIFWEGRARGSESNSHRRVTQGTEDSACTSDGTPVSPRMPPGFPYDSRKPSAAWSLPTLALYPPPTPSPLPSPADSALGHADSWDAPMPLPSPFRSDFSFNTSGGRRELVAQREDVPPSTRRRYSEDWQTHTRVRTSLSTDVTFVPSTSSHSCLHAHAELSPHVPLERPPRCAS
ncbi:hypothetical protein WOLCODRAFT_160144 [Wolfiporia cocos MD-104 SS10]|uniref:Uncharacterized protein n=1 Tax=Wolfiporia cocos (strain MD-104) TaxID=742152 RepID=A0A2H3IUZ1_WOLCO|nr:hypothetical protein WOLCODRAFT_160144 [Wolfiporia cocos MD-104 SS10]